MRSLILIVLASACATLSAQPPRRLRVDPRHTYQRLITVVPMTGTGTRTDPFRPAYAPLATPGRAPVHSGIIAYSYQLSDDKKFALVEFVSTDAISLAPLLSNQTVKAFQKGKDKRDDIEKELKKYKKDFDLDTLQTRVR